MHLHKKFATAIAFAVILNAIPASAQQLWTALESGDWNRITWSSGSQYGTPGDEDAIIITGKEITNGSANHKGSLSITGGQLSLTSYSGQLRTGAVEIGGTGAEWITSGLQKFDKVDGKSQYLIVTYGAKMQTWQTQIGITGGEYAVGNVSGTGTQLIQLERLTVGYTGNGRLSITNLASATANNSIIGDAAGSNGEMTVWGVSAAPPADSQTKFDSGARLTVGKQGTGSLSVLNGALATAKNIIIGGQADNGLGDKGHGTVTVSGRATGMAGPVRSRLSATEGDIKIGDGGTGHLIVKDNGAVSASGRILLGSNGGSGSITIGDSESVDPFTARQTGIITATEIHGDGGEAKVNFHLSSVHDAHAPLATRITGNAVVNIDGWEGGMAILANDSTYTGGTNIYGAGLLVTNASQVGTGAIHVAGGSLYLGTGITLSNEILLADNSHYSREVAQGADLTMNVQSANIGGASTSAAILAGTQAVTSPVTTSFGLASSAINDDLRISDVFSFSGTGESIFVLELKVDDVSPEAFLGWFDGNQWVNAIDENEGNTDYALSQFLGTYEEFALLNGGDLASHLGAWGIYEEGVWAVLNHNSDFSIVASIPEPSTYGLIFGGAVVLRFIRRRRK